MGTVAACGGSGCVCLGERIKEGGDVALDINHRKRPDCCCLASSSVVTSAL